MGRISNAILGNRYTVTFPDGSTQKINAGAYKPTHAILGRSGGHWEATPCLSLAEVERDMPWLHEHDWTELHVVPLTLDGQRG